jgi:hypothetical protein
MLIEIWERLRGYDKWVETEATINSSRLADVELFNSRAAREWRSASTLAWTDQAGQQHSASFEVSDNSPLFQLYEGQTVTIRCNPANPNEFYLPGVLKSRVMSGIKWTVLTIAVAAAALFILLVH